LSMLKNHIFDTSEHSGNVLASNHQSKTAVFEVEVLTASRLNSQRLMECSDSKREKVHQAKRLLVP